MIVSLVLQDDRNIRPRTEEERRLIVYRFYPRSSASLWSWRSGISLHKTKLILLMEITISKIRTKSKLYFFQSVHRVVYVERSPIYLGNFFYFREHHFP